MGGFNSPAEVVGVAIEAGVRKARLSVPRTLLLSVLAGAFIALGAAASSTAMHDIGNVGVARLVAGCIFPVGLILIVVVGGELFTGNCLMVEALCDRKITLASWLRNLALVFAGNLAGSLLVVGLVLASGQFAFSGGALGAFTIKVALAKATLPFGTAFGSAVLCNVLVCAAVLGAFAAKDVAGKIAAIFFPIMAFVLCGFEHCIANMFYIPAGMAAAANPAYAEAATTLYGITPEAMEALSAAGMAANIVPVTLGNIAGGVAIGLAVYYAFKIKKANLP